jgi:ATPase subunit of ABC transporter with duplicated ATPase domains
VLENVNLKLESGKIYGLVGRNGSGKSVLLKIMTGLMEPTSGRVILEPGKRMSVLNQNHNLFDEYTVLETVLMGNKVLHAIKTEMDALYADYTDENANRIGELQLQFDEMNGWNAESDAATMLSNLEIGAEHHYTLMADLDGKLKVRVLLAQALFGNPDVLIMDEPTNDLDLELHHLEILIQI